ncbi:DUF4272 domain-containing protein [Rhizobium croatiense]|uniref:DUF4272 domain-containing protein n=1 Tax=Rhizobium croatiense TaxID=2867516 RepID=UPI00248B3107|nr:DUF4272 domain-containing protein [Rhizobium croatiense]
MKRIFSVLLALILPVQAAVSQTPDEAQARKARSIAQLQSEGVPTIDHLPTIEAESDSSRRDNKAVVERGIALAIVAVKGETGDHAMGETLIRQFDAASFLTPKGTGVHGRSRSIGAGSGELHLALRRRACHVVGARNNT